MTAAKDTAIADLVGCLMKARDWIDNDPTAMGQAERAMQTALLDRIDRTLQRAQRAKDAT